MKSRVDEVLKDLDEAIGRRLEASGIVIENETKDRIRALGLIDNGRMINSWTHNVDGRSVKVGTPIDSPPYPFFLNNGFRHWRSGELVGPYRFVESGASNAEGQLRRIWGAPIR